MASNSYTSEGIVLARKNYGEADRILVIYTRDLGRLSLIAKAVRKPKSKKRGAVEVFSHIRFQGIHTRGIDLITEAEVIDSFNEVRLSLPRVTVAYYFLEVIGRTTHENESHPEIFEILLRYLKSLETVKKLKTLRGTFAYEILVTLGFWPHGTLLTDPDAKLQEVIERELSSLRIGKKLVS